MGGGGGGPFSPKNPLSLIFLRNSRKQTRVIRCTNIGLQLTYEVKIILYVNLSYSSQNTFKEIAVSATPIAEDISMIRSMTLLTTELAYALSMLIGSMLLTHCCPMVLRWSVFNLRNALNDHSAEHIVASITSRIFTTLENSGNISNRFLVHCLQHF